MSAARTPRHLKLLRAYETPHCPGCGFDLHGLPATGTALGGDLLVTLRVTLPEKIDAEFEGLMRKWASVNPYDPRKDMI